MKLNSKTVQNDFEIDIEGITENMLAIAQNKDIGVLYFDENSVISTLKISSEYSENKNKHVFSFDKEGCELLYNEAEYFELLKKEIEDEDKSKVIMNMFFGIHKKFNEIHWSWPYDIPQDKPRLLFCGLLCNSKDKKLIDSSLEFLYTSFNFRDSYKDSIPKIDVKGYNVFLIDISTFYHMTNSSLFAVKKSFASKLNLIKGEKREVIGKNDFYAQDDPQRNPLHPDCMSIEQKIRVGLTHKKALEIVKSQSKRK